MVAPAETKAVYAASEVLLLVPFRLMTAPLLIVDFDNEISKLSIVVVLRGTFFKENVVIVFINFSPLVT